MEQYSYCPASVEDKWQCSGAEKHSLRRATAMNSTLHCHSHSGAERCIAFDIIQNIWAWLLTPGVTLNPGGHRAATRIAFTLIRQLK